MASGDDKEFRGLRCQPAIGGAIGGASDRRQPAKGGDSDRLMGNVIGIGVEMVVTEIGRILFLLGQWVPIPAMKHLYHAVFHARPSNF